MNKFLQTLGSDPVTAIAAATDAVFSFANNALPPTEIRIARFKLLFPKRYARIKRRILNEHLKWLRQHKNIDVNAYINFVCNDEKDREELKKILAPGK